ncbi:MAG TPA: MFS transporter [Rhodopila sp.]|nr:MFS transporter [Rhodopila sp.]
MAQTRRFLVYAGIFVMMALCYIDRINLSVAAKSIAASYGLSSVQLGFVFSSFLWTYLVCLVPLGMAVDRWGARSVTAASLLVWSVGGVLTGMATTYAGLFASRLALGVGEAASYPAGGRVIREWAPRSERGLAAALLNSGAYAGLAAGAPVVGWLVSAFGWRVSFFATGGVGIVMAIAWLLIYRGPEQAGWLRPVERARILGERGDTVRRRAEGGGAIGSLLRSPSMWGLALTQGCAGYTLYLFMTWLPTYLADTRGLDVMRSGAFSAVPYAAAVPLGLLLGLVSDRFLRRSDTAQGGRRRIVAASLLVSAVILLTPLVTNIWLILLMFSVSLTCVSTAMGMNIALTNDLLVDGAQTGAATSLLILGGNSFGIVAPIATGYIVATPFGYAGAFVIAGVLLLAGVATALLLTRNPIGAGRTMAPGLASTPSV